jgi:hypothetical protein
VYDCRWGTDTIRVVVAGELPREPQNAPLHLFSASPDLVRFGSKTYRRRSEASSLLLVQLFEGLQREGLGVAYTMEDFKRQFIKDHFAQLTAEERREILKSLPSEEQVEVLQALPPANRLAGLSVEQIREYLDQLTAGHHHAPPKPRRKK